MKNDEIDNEKLMQEIASLDDDAEDTAVNYNKTKRFPIVIGIIVLIGLCILYFGDAFNYDFLTEVNEEYSDKQIENYMNQEELARKKFDEQKNKVAVSESYLNYNNELIATISNNSDDTITDLKVEVIFYNEENKPIEIDACDVSILDTNSTCYVKFKDTPESFERYDFLISKEYYWYDNLEYVTSQVSYEIIPSKEYVDLVVTNNYSKEISEISFEVLYYDKDNKVMDVEHISFYELKKNKSQDEELYLSLWDNKTYDEVEYATYEINLLGAYIY